MRKFEFQPATLARIGAAMLFAVVLMTGCADSPTAPQGGITAGNSGPNSDYVLDPIIVIGTPGCDPYLDANFCQGPGTGTCITSGPDTGDPEYVGITSCPGDGGGGAGGDGGTTSPPPASEPPPTEPTDTCYTGEPMVDDPDVHGLFNDLWQQSLQQGVEMGGWIVQDGTNNYRLIPFQNAVYTPCGVDIYEAPPANLVSMFHTHPWQFGESRMCDGAYSMYTGTPSPEDQQALQQLGLSTGYFIDYTGVAKYMATGGEKATMLGRCGY